MTNIPHLSGRLGKQLRQMIRPRRRGVRIFGVGASKTGTHTLAEMFEDRIRCGHEADANRLIRLILHKIETGNARPLYRFLRLRDAVRNFKIDSSSINAYLIDEILTLYPDSRFILTVRAPGPWLRSMVDHSVLRDPTDEWKRFRTYRFGLREGHPTEETALDAAGLYPIAAYLGYWRQSVSAVLDRVPDDRLLVLNTEEMGRRAGDIAAFCGLAATTGPKMTHAYANRFRSGLLDRLDDGYIEARLEREVGDLARRVLPGWTAAEDVARLRRPAPTA